MNQTMLRYSPRTRIFNYIPIPRTLIGRELPSTAVVIYGLLLDRCQLSQKNGLFQENGWVYAVFPRLELADTLGISVSAVKKNLSILEKAGLIRRVQRSRREANRFYLLVPESCASDTDGGKNVPLPGEKSDTHRGKFVAPSYPKKSPYLSYAYHRGEDSL